MDALQTGGYLETGALNLTQRGASLLQSLYDCARWAGQTSIFDE